MSSVECQWNSFANDSVPSFIFKHLRLGFVAIINAKTNCICWLVVRRFEKLRQILLSWFLENSLHYSESLIKEQLWTFAQFRMSFNKRDLVLLQIIIALIISEFAFRPPHSLLEFSPNNCVKNASIFVRVDFPLKFFDLTDFVYLLFLFTLGGNWHDSPNVSFFIFFCAKKTGTFLKILQNKNFSNFKKKKKTTKMHNECTYL